jgi:hypothetical protein
MQKFWFEHQENNYLVYWMSWGRMGLSKESSGLGFHNFTCFKKALLAKQAWRLWSQLNSLVVQIMRAKYFPGSSIVEAKICWRL